MTARSISPSVAVEELLTNAGGSATTVRSLRSWLWKTPTYKLILSWNPDALPADWEAGRRRYFTINWIQMAVTWTAFALFLVALISL